MKPLVAVAFRSLFLILLAIAAGLAAGQPAAATDTYSPDWWWVDLKPWGDGRISYALCAIPYELPPEWEQGVENWEAAMATWFIPMEFDLDWGGCYAAPDTILAWELGNECIQDDVIACAWLRTWVDHGTWWEMKRVNIYFDRDWYYNLGYWQDAWQVAASAHEWGHVMNLVTEYRDQCTVPIVIMGLPNLSAAPCVTGPTPAEISAVVMNYGLLDSDGDSLGLGPAPGGFFPNATELFIGTDPEDPCADTSTPNNEDPDPWPPDFNDTRKVTVGDLVLFSAHYNNPSTYDHRYDLNASGPPTITSGDLVIFTQYYTGNGHDTCTVG